MGTVIYSMSVTLDGYIAGPDGAIDWAAPDDDLMALHNAQTRELAAHLCGRKLYEDMLPWETDPDRRETEFGRTWATIPKTVFSTSLQSVEGNATLATRDVADTVREQRAHFAGNVSVGGAGLAAQLIGLDLIDEYRLFVNPVTIGGGTPYFPSPAKGHDLDLIESHIFDSGVAYLRYRRT